MEVASGRSTVDDDIAAALRRAVAFAGLFAVTAIAAIACTARTPQPAAGIATDRLMAQEALWNAEATRASAIAFPPALLARRKDPKVATILAEVQQQLSADQSASAARRSAVLRQMDEARAERDLHESQRTVLLVKIEQAHALMQQRGSAGATPALERDLALLKVQEASSYGGVVLASRKLKLLTERMMTLAKAEQARADTRLESVRTQLRGG